MTSLLNKSLRFRTLHYSTGMRILSCVVNDSTFITLYPACLIKDHRDIIKEEIQRQDEAMKQSMMQISTHVQTFVRCT